MIKRKNGTECYTLDAVTNIFLFKTTSINLDSFVDNNWTTCVSCGLMFRIKEDNSTLCSDECDNQPEEMLDDENEEE